jgi:ABC-type polysaccharide/polyol phosphate transport system ATPase subunit
MTLRLGRPNDARANALDERLAVLVENVSKRRTVVHEARYAPAMSLFSRLYDRRVGLVLDTAGIAGAVAPDEEDDEEDDARPDEGEEPGAGDGAGEWRLRDVSFNVERGEAVGIVGTGNSGVRTLVRILSGMTTPSAGRVLVRGRPAPSVELATVLSRRELHPRHAARLLARVSGIPRRERAAYVREALRFALGDSLELPASSGTGKDLSRRVAVAAALDPSADLLVVDRLPAFGDPDFRQRCLRRLGAAIDGGAAAVVACDDLDIVAELCSRAVWLDGGVVVLEGVAADVVEEFRRVRRTEHEGDSVRQAGFNAYAALLTVETTDADHRPRTSFAPDEEVHVRVRLELAHGGTTVSCRARLRGESTLKFVQDSVVLVDAGEHVAVLRLPAGLLAEGDYAIDAEVVVSLGGKQSAIQRRGAARLAVEARDDFAVTAEPETVAPPDDGTAADAEWEIFPDGDGTD